MKITNKIVTTWPSACGLGFHNKVVLKKIQGSWVGITFSIDFFTRLKPCQNFACFISFHIACVMYYRVPQDAQITHDIYFQLFFIFEPRRVGYLFTVTGFPLRVYHHYAHISSHYLIVSAGSIFHLESTLGTHMKGIFRFRVITRFTG